MSGNGKDTDALDQLENIDAQIRSCTLCRLSETRTHAVPGSGRKDNPLVVFVGEGPGRNEDLQGKPFVGAGGRLLDELLKNAGLERNEVYITNIVKCRPPGNRKPLPDEVSICTSNYLEVQLALLKPNLVCTLGATALEYFTGEKKMGENHGKILSAKKSGLPVLPTYHPASVFRNPKFRALLQQDLQEIPGVLSSENTVVPPLEKAPPPYEASSTKVRRTKPRAHRMKLKNTAEAPDLAK